MEDAMIAAAMTAPDLLAAKRVLAIQPHPDDNEIAMGATLARLTAQGTEVVYLTVTNGDRGMSDPDTTPAQMARIRAEELEAAGRHLGVSRFYNLNLPDGCTLDVSEIAVMIAGVIRQVRPDTVLCPDPWLPYEGHSDHRKTGMAAVEGFMNAGTYHYPRGASYEPFGPSAIGFYFTAHPNQVIDTTDYMDKMFEAIALHKSQVDEQTLALYRAFFTMKGKELAQGKGFEVGEGFKMLRPLHLHCFVDAYRI
jgi:LmbE family N-acetylglucosaminyl deacetylase